MASTGGSHTARAEGGRVSPSPGYPREVSQWGLPVLGEQNLGIVWCIHPHPPYD